MILKRPVLKNFIQLLGENNMFCQQEFSLRDINEEDLQTMLLWRNSARVRSKMFTHRIISVEEHSNWYKRQKEDNRNKYMMFAKGGHALGVTYFNNIDWDNKLGFWGFYLGSDNLPRGMGTVMGWISLEYAFNILNLRKVCGEILSFNIPSIKVFKKLGFTEEGRLREQISKENMLVDLVFMGLLRNEWVKKSSELNKKIFYRR